MRIETLQWNIGGGRTRPEGSDPSSEESYNLKNIDYFGDLISRYNPDLVTLQETHKDLVNDQGAELARRLGYQYFVTDSYDESHIENGQQLSQSILAKYPIKSHRFNFLFNPKLRLARPDGTLWISHDKGVTICSTTLPDGKTLDVITVHMIPFRKFETDINSESVQKIFTELAEKIPRNGNIILFQGDFNIDKTSLKGSSPCDIRDWP